MGFVFNSCASDDSLVQQRFGWKGAKGRLRREDCKFVKHDKVFSQWKILVGPSDSTGHRNSAGKEGVGKFEIHNLPAAQIGPGVYELGVTAPSWSQASNKQLSTTRSLKREDVIPVYIGQAANIRKRLQKYGQANAHLEPGSRSSKQYQGDSNSVGSKSPCPSPSRSSPRIVQGRSGESAKSAGSGPGLFSEVFALGCSIAFRWAHTDSRVVAEQVESELLAVFDYAWNKGIGGARRSGDILAKLFMAWPTTKDTKSSCNLVFSPGKKTVLWLFRGRPNAVGIKVALRKPQDTTTSTNSNRILMRSICFLMTSQPQGSIRVASLDLRCGVVTSEGIPCKASPLRGRKRCLQHQEIPRRGRVPPPASASPHPSKQITMGSMKLQTEPMKTRRCLPGGFLGSEYFLPTKTRTSCKVPAAAKEEKPAERKRYNSLSFNTWMKGDTDQRIHDSSGIMIELANKTLYQKPATKQEKGQAVPGKRVQSDTVERL